MSHDLIAELDGYRNELMSAERYGRDEKAAAVREQLDRVTTEIEGRADRLHAQADGHEQNGEAVLAAQVRVEANRLRSALPGGENAAESAPRQTATTKRTKGGA